MKMMDANGTLCVRQDKHVDGNLYREQKKAMVRLDEKEEDPADKEEKVFPAFSNPQCLCGRPIIESTVGKFKIIRPEGPPSRSQGPKAPILR